MLEFEFSSQGSDTGLSWSFCCLISGLLHCVKKQDITRKFVQVMETILEMGKEESIKVRQPLLTTEIHGGF